MDGFWGRFLCYRFDSAALAFDCIATFFGGGRPVGRALALFWAAFMFSPPVFVLVIGNDRFGDSWAFGLTLVFYLIALEAPGRLWRRGVVNGDAEGAGPFDRFLFTLFTIASMAAPFVLFEVPIQSRVALGIVWGVALVGAQDVARSAIACSLVLFEGRPVYVR